PNTLDFVCALDKNGSLRWVTDLANCRKQETGVTVSAGLPTCYQIDGSARKVANQAACVAPGTYLSLPPLNVSQYFCADSDGRLTRVAGPGLCGGSTEVVSNATNH